MTPGPGPVPGEGPLQSDPHPLPDSLYHTSVRPGEKGEGERGSSRVYPGTPVENPRRSESSSYLTPPQTPDNKSRSLSLVREPLAYGTFTVVLVSNPLKTHTKTITIKSFPTHVHTHTPPITFIPTVYFIVYGLNPLHDFVISNKWT